MQFLMNDIQKQMRSTRIKKEVISSFRSSVSMKVIDPFEICLDNKSSAVTAAGSSEVDAAYEKTEASFEKEEPGFEKEDKSWVPDKGRRCLLLSDGAWN